MNSVKAPPLRIAHPKLATCLDLSEVNPTALTFGPCTLEAERTSLIKMIVMIRFGHCTEEISLLLPESFIREYASIEDNVLESFQDMRHRLLQASGKQKVNAPNLTNL